MRRLTAIVERPLPQASLAGASFSIACPTRTTSLDSRSGCIVGDQLPLCVVERIHRHQIAPHDRPRMRVRAANGDLTSLELEFLADIVAHGQRKIAVDSHQVERDDHSPSAAGVLQDQRLGPQVDRCPFGGMIAAAVSRHPHEALRRNLDRGRPRLPIGRGRPVDAETAQHRQQGRQTENRISPRDACNQSHVVISRMHTQSSQSRSIFRLPVSRPDCSRGRA